MIDIKERVNTNSGLTLTKLLKYVTIGLVGASAILILLVKIGLIKLI